MKYCLTLLLLSCWVPCLFAARTNTVLSATVLSTITTNVQATTLQSEVTPEQLATNGVTFNQDFSFSTNQAIPVTLSSQAYNTNNQPIASDNQVTLTGCHGETHTLTTQAQSVTTAQYTDQGCDGKSSQLSIHIPPQQAEPGSIEQQSVMVMVGSQ